MKINILKTQSAYDVLSFALSNWATKNNKWGALIIDIKTTIMSSKDRIVAIPDGYGGYDFDYDWYEGGELELLGITPIEEVDTKYQL